jgi:hypothetical protein
MARSEATRMKKGGFARRLHQQSSKGDFTPQRVCCGHYQVGEENHMKSMRIIKTTVTVILMSVLVISCGRSKRQRLAIAYVIDMTASVDSEAIQQAFAALQPLLNSKTLKRGDSVTIIPITGDTMTESQGKILRIHLPENREVYDADLVKLAKEVEQKLKQMQDDATASPYQHSDILGAADLAAEELSTETGNVRKVIVILSDFIQDDARFNFNTSSDLATDRAAITFAKKLNGSSEGTSQNHSQEPSKVRWAENLPSPDADRSQATQGKFAGMSIYLGLLRSKDLKKMPPQRREGVQAFWREYFKTGAAHSFRISTDGPGKVESSIETDN